MVKKKGKSKRTSLQDKYKIQRRVTDTKRKRHKQSKRDAASGVVRHNHKSKKDPGIPNSWPFKQDLLQEIQRTRQRDVASQKSIKDKRTAELRALRQHQEQGGTAKTVQELVEQAQQDQQAFALKSGSGGSTATANDNDDGTATKKDNHAATPVGQASRRAYLKELKKVVDTADVLLQVLDARDPLGSRIHPSVEAAILSKCTNKKMVLVLNKIDLVPSNVVRDWLLYLRRSHPTIAIKASNKSTAPDAVHDTADGGASSTSSTTLSPTTPVGMEGLLQLLKNYARTSGPGGGGDNKTTVVVGIIGYPNVGKSSIINALKRNRHAVGVSPKPGFTTSMQEVVLDRNIRLLDSPGVVFDDHSAFLGNCIDVASMDDPIPAISQLLKRCRLPTLLMLYNIPAFSQHDDNAVDMFLALIAKRHGRVLKGGIPDKIGAARHVLQDWNCGKIPYFTVPPTVDKTHVEQDAVVVSRFGKEFDLQAFDDAVLNDDDNANVVTASAAAHTGAASLKEMDTMDYLQLSNPTYEQTVDERKMTAGALGGVVSTQEAVDILMGKANSDGDDDNDESDSDAMEEEEGDDDDDDIAPSKPSRKQLAKAEDCDFSDL